MREGFLIGLDLGGTHVKAAIGPMDPAEGSTEDQRAPWSTRVPTNADSGRDAVLAAIRSAAEAARDEVERRGGPLLGIGLGSPGVIDPESGVALYDTANLPEWQGVPLQASLEEPFGVPVRIGNDASVAALAEARWGAAQGASDVVMATVGTGIGGGAVAKGTLVTGAWGAGMELGHIPFAAAGDPDARRCGCGKRGCIEAYAGGRGLRAAWHAALIAAGEDAAAVSTLELPEMLARAKDGDPVANGLLEEGAEALASGILASLYLLNPSVVVFGGGVVDGFPSYVDWVEKRVRERALEKVTDRLTFARAQFGNQAGVLGAMALAAAAVDSGSTAETAVD